MRLRALWVSSILFAGVALLPGTALASHCPPSPGLDDDWCHQTAPPGAATPTPEPTPEATPVPTVAPTPAPTKAPVAPVRRATPAPTVNPIQVPPEETISVDVPGAVFDEELPLDTAEPTASATVWIFGFIVGFLIGAIVGRASWGLGRRRRRQQIFG